MSTSTRLPHAQVRDGVDWQCVSGQRPGRVTAGYSLSTYPPIYIIKPQYYISRFITPKYLTSREHHNDDKEEMSPQPQHRKNESVRYFLLVFLMVAAHTLTHKFFFLPYMLPIVYKGYIAFGLAADLDNYVTVLCVIVNLQLSEVKCVLLKVLVVEHYMLSGRCRQWRPAVRVTVTPTPTATSATPSWQTPARHCPMAEIHKYLGTATNCCNSHMPQPTLTYNQWLMFTYA